MYVRVAGMKEQTHMTKTSSGEANGWAFKPGFSHTGV